MPIAHMITQSAPYAVRRRARVLLRGTWLGLLLLVCALPVRANPEFPLPDSLAPAVRFWTYAFTQLDENQGAVHDTRRLDIVYEVVELWPGSTSAERAHTARSAKQRYRGHLLAIASGDTGEPGSERWRVRSLWHADVTPAELRAAAGRLRFQRGLADTMRAGVIRAGAWEDHISTTLAQSGVPRELIALPLLEAAYDPWTYSHADAFGLWQFIPSTGRKYLRIDTLVDERLHLEKATKGAAALLLQYNSEVGNWPLTLTAYNHGNGGVRRAIRELGTHDIAEIVARYKGPQFGFASRNYYASFLAALEIYDNAQLYFGPLDRHAPEQVERLVLNEPMRIDQLELELGFVRDRLRYHNPALMAPVWAGSAAVPRGYAMRVPLDAGQHLDSSWPLRDVSLSVRAPRSINRSDKSGTPLKSLTELLW